MKLIFKKIRLKNFMSIGAVPVEFDYNSGIHAIVGKPILHQETTNGSGKSSFGIDGIVFALFGKSIRELTKKDMINNINEGECEVTLWIAVDGVNWRIERGLEPDYFNVINEDTENEEETKETAKRPTQQKLNELLKISYTSFLNTITLNINYSKPFFKLPVSDKRTILEDVINLSVYGKMYENIKKEWNSYKTEKRILESEIAGLQAIYLDKKNTLEKIDFQKITFEAAKELAIKTISDSIKLNQEKADAFRLKLPKQDFNDIKKKLSETKDILIQKFSQISSNISSLESDKQKSINNVKKIKDNPICPLCKTPTVHSEHSQKYILDENTIIENINIELSTLIVTKPSIEEKLKEVKEKLNKVDDLIGKTTQLKEIIKRLETIIDEETKNLNKEIKKTFDLNSIISQTDVDNAKLKYENKQAQYNEVCESMQYADYITDMLGDKGIKKYIIKKIVPLLNKKTNEYLSLFKANYNITFDSDLKETFKTRGSKERVYASFSAGEQKRIDLAFMFALLDVSKNQSSIDSNILILDEIIDSSICANGILQLMTFLKNDFMTAHPDMAVYVISHKAEITENHFNSIITVKKENDFTKIDSIRQVEQILQV